MHAITMTNHARLRRPSRRSIDSGTPGIKALAALALLILLGTVLGASSAEARGKLRVSVTPKTVAPGQPYTVKVVNAAGRKCRVSIRADRRGSNPTLRRSTRGTLRTLLPASAKAGRRIVSVRCGSRRASTRFTVGTASTTGRDGDVGPLKYDQEAVDGYRYAGAVGGSNEYATQHPFPNGTAFSVTQGPGGGFSHNTPRNRNAADLVAPEGTDVVAGFTGVVAVAQGGCPPTPSDACNQGAGNYVMLKAADGTCATHFHLSSIAVAPGQQIKRSTKLGTLGNSGFSRGAHLHYDRRNCATQESLPWSFEGTGIPVEGQALRSNNSTEVVAPPPPPPPPASVAVTVDNRVTNGSQMREDPAGPTFLTTQPVARCGSRNCNIAGTERGTGGRYESATCQQQGERITNGNDASAADDSNPERFESTRYLRVTLASGQTGFVSEVWLKERGGMNLPTCT